jgi:hypothetical protein
VHSGSMKQLGGDLDKSHNAALSKLVKSLGDDHTSALSKLADQLVKVHAAAMAKFVKDEAAAAEKAARAAAEAKAVSTLSNHDKVVADAAKADSDRIADSTKVYLDQQAAAGLSGAALIAANAQTNFDQVTQGSNQAIDAAQMGVDQSEFDSPLQQAQAADALNSAQAAAQVAQAQAQATLDVANAAATAAAAIATASTATADTTATDTTASTAPTIAPVMNFNIYGNGTLTAGQLIGEAAFAIRTGALPVAPPPPVGALA